MVHFLQWVVWGLALVLAIGFAVYMRKDAQDGNPIHIVTVLQSAAMFAAPVLFLFEPWSKFNLIWVVPVCALGLIPVAFVVFRIPILGTALRVICLSFARFVLAGVGGTIRGVPYGK